MISCYFYGNRRYFEINVKSNMLHLCKMNKNIYQEKKRQTYNPMTVIWLVTKTLTMNINYHYTMKWKFMYFAKAQTIA